MENKGEGSGVAVAIVIAFLVILMVAGGGGVYYLVHRQRMELMMHAERAQMAELEARMQAEQARDQARLAATARMTMQEQQPIADQTDSIRAAITAILNTQVEAWNRGDLAAFMEHYWKSKELTFSSSGNTTRGWTETLNRYRERYPTAEKMGRLQLDGFEITPLGDSAALVLGQWQVERESEPLSGNFSLIVRKFDDHWLIVHDHTSRKMD